MSLHADRTPDRSWQFCTDQRGTRVRELLALDFLQESLWPPPQVASEPQGGGNETAALLGEKESFWAPALLP